MAWCENLHPEEVDWLYMLIPRWESMSPVIVHAKDLISECLRCKEWHKCEDKRENVRYLENNKFPKNLHHNHTKDVYDNT